MALPARYTDTLRAAHSKMPTTTVDCFRNVAEQIDGPTAMGEKQHSIYFSQLKAMLKRNILLKKREKRKTTAVSTA